MLRNANVYLGIISATIPLIRSGICVNMISTDSQIIPSQWRFCFYKGRRSKLLYPLAGVA